MIRVNGKAARSGKEPVERRTSSPCARQPARPAFAFAAAVLTIGLAACAVGPNFVKPAAPSDPGYLPGGQPPVAGSAGDEARQTFVVGDRITQGWWGLFGSRDLDALVRRALANNQSLAAARATLAQAREASIQARGGLYPQADFSGSVARLRTSLLPEGVNQLGPVTNDFAFGPSVSYALDIFGAQKRLREQKDALLEYQGYQLQGAYLALSGNVVGDAIDLARLQAQIDALAEVTQEDEQTLDMVRRQFALHYKTLTDLESSRSQLASDRALLPPLRQQQAIIRDALAVLTGRTPGEALAPDFRMDGLTLPQTLPVVVPSALVHDRPDVRAAEAQLHAASASIGIATAQLYPSLTLSASLTQESLSTATLFTNSAMSWMVASAVSAPIFHGGALQAQKRGAVDVYQVAYATYRQTVLEAFSQVADVLQALENDANALQAQQDAVDSATRALAAARAGYVVARVDVVSVLSAERQLRRARIDYVQAKAQRYRDTAQLFGAMGGGWLTPASSASR
jgi:NodT family efflux transporter outer membrane factor (OMF) lipoprotein